MAKVTPIPRGAEMPADERFGDSSEASDVAPAPLVKIGDLFTASILRIERRCSGKEKPIALPWPVLADHYGGGLWPGLHVLNKGTGVGGTQFALQVALHAAKAGVPGLYIGLELGNLDLALRVLGEEARVPWSHLWTGKAGPAYVERVRKAAPALADLPFHVEVARPHGYSASDVRSAVQRLRATYPEVDGPGSRPLLLVVDFLQLIGDETGESAELRARVGRTSYVLRELANRLGIAVLCISSVARERYRLLSAIQIEAGLTYDLDGEECPIARRISAPDAIVGAGKEAGEIEYSADSVSVLAPVADTRDAGGVDVVFATAKGRATGPMWSPLRFTGQRYEECSDRGGRMVEAWKAVGEKREAARAEKAAAKEATKATRLQDDIARVREHVLANPRCSVRSAREVIGDSSARWLDVVRAMGPALQQTEIHARKVELTILGEA